MLGRKLHPVVDRVMLVNRGEESELVEETTNTVVHKKGHLWITQWHLMDKTMN